MYPSAILNNSRGERICGRFRSTGAHAEQKGPELSRLETVQVSKTPTTASTTNGDVLTNEEATVHVELDLFVTVKLLEDTPGVLSLGKLCEEHGYSFESPARQLPHVV